MLGKFLDVFGYALDTKKYWDLCAKNTVAAAHELLIKIEVLTMKLLHLHLQILIMSLLEIVQCH